MQGLKTAGAAPRSERLLTCILAGVTLLGPMSVDMYLPALPAMARSLVATESALQLTITAFLLGFSLGPLVLAPLSDAIGRRGVLIGCVSIFVLMSLLCALANSVEELIGYRLVQALSGGSATTIARTIVHDLYQGDLAAKKLSTLMMVLSAALMAAPALGGQLLTFFGWRSLFVTLAIIGSLSLLSIILFLPETLTADRRRPFRFLAVLKSYEHFLTSRPAMGFIMASAFSGGAMFAYLAATPFIFIDYYALDPTLYGAFFAANMIGAILINGLNRRLVTRFGYRRMLIGGALMLLANGGALFIVASHDIGGLAGMALAVFPIVGLAHIMGTNGLAGMFDLFRDRAGTAAATFAASRFAAGMLTTLLIGVLNDGAPWPLGVVVLICAVMAMLGAMLTVASSR